MQAKLVFALAFLLICALGTVGCSALKGFGRPTVEEAHLAQLSEDGVESLKETEHEFFAAGVAVEEAEQRLERLRKAKEAAEERVDVEQLDLKAARAELKAAKANDDDDRIEDARKARERAKDAFERSKEALEQAERACDLAELELEAAQARRTLAKAEQAEARVRRLQQENAEAASSYELEEFTRAVEKARQRYEKLERRVESRKG